MHRRIVSRKVKIGDSCKAVTMVDDDADHDDDDDEDDDGDDDDDDDDDDWEEHQKERMTLHSVALESEFLGL